MPMNRRCLLGLAALALALAMAAVAVSVRSGAWGGAGASARAALVSKEQVDEEHQAASTLADFWRGLERSAAQTAAKVARLQDARLHAHVGRRSEEPMPPGGAEARAGRASFLAFPLLPAPARDARLTTARDALRRCHEQAPAISPSGQLRSSAAYTSMGLLSPDAGAALPLFLLGVLLATAPAITSPQSLLAPGRGRTESFGHPTVGRCSSYRGLVIIVSPKP